MPQPTAQNTSPTSTTMTTAPHTKRPQPHALMFPYPVQGHINPMMQLAKRLLHHGFFITFVNTEFNHQRLVKGGVAAKLEALPNLRLEHLPDGLPPSHGRANAKNGVIEFTAAILALPGPFAKLIRRIVSSNDDRQPPLTCIIADAFCSWVQDVADQFAVPRVALWTTPVHANLAYTFQETLASEGYIPVTDKSKLLEVVKCIDGIAPMKLEDYISFFLVDTATDFLFQWHLRFCMRRPEDAAWNLGNNIEELEKDAVLAFKKVVPSFLPIGPLLPDDVLIDAARHENGTDFGAAAGVSLWPEDGCCKDWLSQHKPGSVIYISFGSIANMREEECCSLIQGIEESGAPFLWAVRPDQDGAALSDLRRRLDSEAVQGKPSGRGLLVSWAPQLTVLKHPAVGAFLSHCGWNSLVESFSAGVPVLAKPGGFAEQRMNGHYVAEVWKVGLLVPPAATAATVKALINALLGESAVTAGIRARISEVRKAALEGISPPTGSSYLNFWLFIDDMYRRAGGACLHRLHV